MSAPLTPERLAEIAARAAHALGVPPVVPAEAEALIGTDVPALLAEVARLRAVLSDAADNVAERDDEIAGWSAKNAALRAERDARQARVTYWRERAQLAERPSRAEKPAAGYTARQGIFNYLTGRAICHTPRSTEEADGLLDAHRAEVLREAAPELDDLCTEYGVLGVGDRLLRMADDAEAGEKDTPAGESTPAPKTADRRAYLLDRIRSGRGQWTPGRVKRLYQRLGLTHVYRATIRADLAALCRDGRLVLHDGSDRRYYTLKDGA